MARVQPSTGVRADDVFATVRETFESRDYLWEQTGPLSATASEGGKPVKHLAVSQRLRVAVRFEVDDNLLVLKQETFGVAYTANGGGIFLIKLSRRFRKMVKAVREDLAAAS